MFKKILVALDGSNNSLLALEKAIELQKLDEGCEILLLCVYKHHSLFEASLAMVRPADIQIPDQALAEFATSVVDKGREHAKALGGHSIKGFVKNGRPSKAIVKFAKDKSVDLVVMGAHGSHSDTDGLLLGSVSQRVGGRAPCPILIV
ncbi:universal stress protein [Reinekea blandensis]|uniref:Universal stress protein family protein n=1 Tax=Reinekea blandensis MED297 TaxID=314283 RepID=A4B9I8_9GAMM|nr:universal stress protein [Reinekea blandensis]EAR11289.1 universal stress protein family protein [Reinekea sp. MED297] [Reinekea blandensis MED297]